MYQNITGLQEHTESRAAAIIFLGLGRIIFKSGATEVIQVKYCELPKLIS